VLNKNHNPHFVNRGAARTFIRKSSRAKVKKTPSPSHTNPTRKLILTQSGLVEVTVPGVPLAPLEVE